MASRVVRVLAGVLCVLSWGANVLAAGTDCDRACLRNALDRYLDAVIKHDPSAAPLFVGFRQTENAVVVRLGTGVWQTVTALGKVQRRYLDPVSGQAAYFGIVEEGGNQAVTTLRLRVEDRKVTEAEWIIARKDAFGPNGPGGALVNPDSLIANPPPERTVPKDARVSRAAMQAIANSYFDGLSTHDGSIILHEPGGTRIENGTVMTGRGRGAGGGRGAPTDGRGAQGAPAAAPAGGSDCSSNLEQLNVSLVAARRYPIIDEEAGVALGMVVFMRKPGTTTRRNLLSEWFFIDNNKIRTIYAAMYYPPPEAPAPNWPPYDGNWPLPATFVSGDAQPVSRGSAAPAPPAPNR
jgi:hypothetical protein